MRLLFLLGAVAFISPSASSLPSSSDLPHLMEHYEALREEVLRLMETANTSRYLDLPGRCDGRLTTESGVPLSTSDRTAQGTLYFTPYRGNTVSLYTGTLWKAFSFSELSLSLAGISADTNYDVFIYSNAGTPTLELSAAWSDGTTRADALALLDGVYVKNGTNTRRWLGTIRGSAANVTESSVAKRFVWNYRNRLPTFMKVSESADSWSLASSSWAAYNGSGTNKIEFVVGLNDMSVKGLAYALGSGTVNRGYATGVGVDSTTVNSAAIFGCTTSGVSGNILACVSEYHGFPGMGYHYLQWLQRANATITLYGDNGDNTSFQASLLGELDG